MVHDREQIKDGRLVAPGIPENYDMGIDVKQNAIYVVVEDASPVTVAAFKSRYGDDVIVREGDLMIPHCTRADCRYGLRSGLRTVLPSEGRCSTAFTVRVTATGNRNILSAAHCGGNDVGSSRRHGGEHYGLVRARQQHGRVDAERHGPPAGDFNMWPRIFVNPDNKFHPVESMSTWEGLMAGTHVCKSGQTTGKTCGQILDKDVSLDYVPNSDRFVLAQYCSEDGDSGSGVYRSANWSRVHGIHSGGTNATCPDANALGVFGHIEYALNALEATLVLAP
jgi:hypothetical protein